jgi:hypothetical protein
MGSQRQANTVMPPQIQMPAVRLRMSARIPLLPSCMSDREEATA